MTIWPQITINTEKDDNRLCFACGQDNPIGLKLNFQQDADGTTRAQFTPTELYQGWEGLVHGGIVICLLDEAMSYAALFEGLNCVTAEIQAKLKSPAPVNEPLLITASVTKKTRKLVKTRAAVSLNDGTLIAEGTATHFVADSSDRKDAAGA